MSKWMVQAKINKVEDLKICITISDTTRDNAVKEVIDRLQGHYGSDTLVTIIGVSEITI